MNVIFKSIDIRGFLSIGNAKVNLAEQGLVYVTGTNDSPGSASSNGSGKSSTFEAVIYALSGSTLRGTTDVINKYSSDKFCEVTLELCVDGNEYSIKRTRNHPDHGNNLKLTKNGEDISGDKLRKSEQILEYELGMLTSSLIGSVIILGQGMPYKFTDLSPAARKDRLEEMSQTSEFINELKNKLGESKSFYSSSLNGGKVDEGKHMTTISLSQESVRRKGEELVKLTNDTFNVQLAQTRIGEIATELETIATEQNRVGEMVKLIQSKQYEFSTEHNKLRTSLAIEANKLTQLHNQYNSVNSSSCPTCGQFINSPDHVAHMKESYTASIDECNRNAAGITESLNKYDAGLKQISDRINDLNNELRSFSNKVNPLSVERMQLETKINSVKSQSTSLQEEIQELQINIRNSETELSAVRDIMNNYTTKLGIVDYLTKQSSKDFRGYLLGGVIRYLDSKIKSYGKILFGTDQLQLMLDNNKIFIQYEDRLYENLSGGERQRADLAMQFSLRDMLMSNLGFSCNLLVIDEGFDNLDESGVDALISLITTMSSVDSIYVISHHTLSIPSDRTMSVKKGLDKVSSIEVSH